MDKANCFHLGYVAKLHGFKGEVSLFLDVTNPSDYDDLEMIFVDLNDQLTPFFIEHSKIRNNGYLTVKLENIDSEIAAKRIVRRKVYLPEEILPVLEGNNFYDHEIVGYTELKNASAMFDGINANSSGQKSKVMIISPLMLSLSGPVGSFPLIYLISNAFKEFKYNQVVIKFLKIFISKLKIIDL